MEMRTPTARRGSPSKTESMCSERSLSDCGSISVDRDCCFKAEGRLSLSAPFCASGSSSVSRVPLRGFSRSSGATQQPRKPSAGSSWGGAKNSPSEKNSRHGLRDEMRRNSGCAAQTSLRRCSPLVTGSDERSVLGVLFSEAEMMWKQRRRKVARPAKSGRYLFAAERSSRRRGCLRALLLPGVLVVCAFLCGLAPGLAESSVDKASAEVGTNAVSVGGERPLLIAEPLSEAAQDLRTEVGRAVASGLRDERLAEAAAKAAHGRFWSPCSKLCGGGIQTPDAEAAAEAAAAALLDEAPSSASEEIQAAAQKAGDFIRFLAKEGALGLSPLPESRTCNTFACPTPLPTCLKDSFLFSTASAAASEAGGSFPEDVVLQVDFLPSCKERLALDSLDEKEWQRRREEHSQWISASSTESGKDGGDGALRVGWEASVVARETLSLHVCLSLCRLHHHCGAVVFTRADVSLPRVQTAASPSASETLTFSSVEELFSNWEEAWTHFALETNPTDEEAPAAEAAGGAECVLYPPLSLKHLNECGRDVGGGERDAAAPLALAVFAPLADLAEVARRLRVSSALILHRHRLLMDSAAEAARSFSAAKEALQVELAGEAQTGEGVSAQSKVESVKARLEKLAKQLEESRRAGRRSLAVMKEALSVVETSAIEADQAVAEAEGEGTAFEKKGDASFSTASMRSSPSLFPKCGVFKGVRLLQSGCIDTPVLRSFNAVSETEASAETTASSSETSSSAWTHCRKALAQAQAALANLAQMLAEGVSRRDQTRPLQKLLGVSALEVERAEAAETESSSVSTNAGVQTSESLQSARLLERVRFLERLAQESGSLFATFSPRTSTCALRGVSFEFLSSLATKRLRQAACRVQPSKSERPVFASLQILEERSEDATQSLSLQFPSACVVFAPGSLLVLPASGEEASGEVETDDCAELPVVVSPWTRWSACVSSLRGERNLPPEVEAVVGVSAKRISQPSWRLRVREVLRAFAPLSPTLSTKEVRLCGAEETRTDKENNLTRKFLSAVEKSAANCCAFSAFSPWSRCSWECKPKGQTKAGLEKGSSFPFKVRTRSLLQQPVWGLAASCDGEPLFEKESCEAELPECEEDETEADESEASSPPPSASSSPPESLLEIGSSRQQQLSTRARFASLSKHIHQEAAASSEELAARSPNRRWKNSDSELMPASASLYPGFVGGLAGADSFAEGGVATPRPYDSPTNDDDSLADLAALTRSASASPETQVAKSAAQAEAESEETSENQEDDDGGIFGLSGHAFAFTCLCGAFASLALALLVVLCSRRVRGWLGWDLGAAAEMTGFTGTAKGGLPAASSIFPLKTADGEVVRKKDGSPLLVSICTGANGQQLTTAEGSKLFVSMQGDIVDETGKEVPQSALPDELLKKLEGKSSETKTKKGDDAGAAPARDSALSASMLSQVSAVSEMPWARALSSREDAGGASSKKAKSPSPPPPPNAKAATDSLAAKTPLAAKPSFRAASLRPPSSKD